MSDSYGSLTRDDLITGEAVALDLPPAGLGIRILSGLVDLGVTIALAVALVFLFVLALGDADAALFHVAFVGLAFVVLVAVPTTVETLTRGRTVGHLVTGLRTVRDDGGPISFQHAFTRALIGVVETYATYGVVALVAVMLSTKGKRVGDYAAGTYVVRERIRLRLPPPLPVPEPLVAWAATADIAPLPPGLALAIRSHLSTPAAGNPGWLRVGDDLLRRTRPLIAPPPPADAPAWAVLQAVLATRRERDAARLRREAALRERLVGRG